MPYLSPEDRKNLIGPTGKNCRMCKAPILRHYCRQCDEFFKECKCLRKDTHSGHRTYRAGEQPDYVTRLLDSLNGTL